MGSISVGRFVPRRQHVCSSRVCLEDGGDGNEMRRTAAVLSPLLILLVAAFTSRQAFAWVYPEHRSIALLAIHDLDEVRREALKSLWNAARKGHEERLCTGVAEPRQGKEPACVDFAAWPAIAGDHSCASSEMVASVLAADWMLDVARISASLERKLSVARGRDEVINALRDSDISLQRADPEYATRAGSNNVHFLIPRAAVGTDEAAYARAAFTRGAEMSALVAYAWYHTDALRKARQMAAPLPEKERAALALAALADEAFALHFLEDVFSAGHVAGTWGDASLRKGTHDYYNEHGIEIVTWRGDHALLTGDAWMRPEDAQRAASAVRKSLEQVLDAARGASSTSHQPTSKGQRQTSAPGTLNVCRTNTVPPRSYEDVLLLDVFRDTPVPMLASGLGAMPRFRAELGPFVGVQAAARGMSFRGGFVEEQRSVGATGGLELGFRVGFGLDGVMNAAGDGLVFLDLGLRRDGSSSNRFADAPSLPEAGAITAAIPGRPAYTVRVRMPFWLLPLDMLFAGPLLLLASPSTLSNMAVVAGNGGLIPWQSGIMTPIGRFQAVLGREIGVGIFGYLGNERDRLIAPNTVDGETRYTVIGLSSIQLEFPVLEYRPFRSFSLDQSSNLVFQVFGAVDLPTRTSVVAPSSDPEPELQAVWYAGLRMSFDWRSYW